MISEKAKLFVPVSIAQFRRVTLSYSPAIDPAAVHVFIASLRYTERANSTGSAQVRDSNKFKKQGVSNEHRDEVPAAFCVQHMTSLSCPCLALATMRELHAKRPSAGSWQDVTFCFCPLFYTGVKTCNICLTCRVQCVRGAGGGARQAAGLRQLHVGCGDGGGAERQDQVHRLLRTPRAARAAFVPGHLPRAPLHAQLEVAPLQYMGVFMALAVKHVDIVPSYLISSDGIMY